MRSAATRVLGYWWDRVPDAVALLRTQARDEHPRVRLEAVRAASWMDDPDAAEAALLALDHPTNYYIDYTLRHTIRRLEEFWKPVVGAGKPFANGNPKAVEYIISRVPTSDLINMARSESVYREILMRHDIAPEYRIEALEGLARLHGTDELTELLTQVDRLDKSEMEHAGHVLVDMIDLFSMQEPEALAAGRALIEQIAKAAKRPVTRRVATVALIAADRSADRVWNDASNSVTALRDVIDAVRLMPFGEIRASLYDRVASLITTLPPELEEKLADTKDNKPPPLGETYDVDGDPRAGVHRSAIAVVSHIPGHDAETFAIFAPLVDNDAYRNVAVQSLTRLDRGNLPQDGIRPMLDRLLGYIRSVPEQQRTGTAAKDAIGLAKDLSGLLPKSEAISIRRQIADLAVDVVVIRPVPHRMRFDCDHVYVQAGKRVELVFENTDIMPHNLVITRPGARVQVGVLAERLGSTPHAFAKQFIPETWHVLHATDMLQPDQRQRLQIVAPADVGDYPYVCTFPGHWRTMYGTMHVVADISDISLTAPEQAADFETPPKR